MAENYDIAIIGAGHNGLVAANYLARGGCKVGVFEAREVVGGACVTDPPYNAKGDDTEDDHAAIQRCVDENDVVVIPRGTFRLSRTLELRPTTRLEFQGWVGCALHTHTHWRLRRTGHAFWGWGEVCYI